MSRNELRKVILRQLRYRNKCNGDSRYITVPLSGAAQEILTQRGTGKLTLPSDPWFNRFFKRHASVIGETVKKTKDVARTAAIKKEDLKDDLIVLGRQCCEPDIAIMTETSDGVFNYLESDNDAKIGRTPGYCARSRLIQVDEKGQVVHLSDYLALLSPYVFVLPQFIWYDHKAGHFKFKRVAVAKGHKAFVPIVENREMFTYVPWATANGDVLFAQVSFQPLQCLIHV